VAALTYLDTHVVAWLYAGRADLLSATARRVVESSELLISPAVVLELQYLHETGRTAGEAERVVADLRTRIELRVCDLPFPEVALHALALSWTRDPFDRLIVAQAAVRDAPLLTKDRAIRRRYRAAVW
jgi:PIN domain nuclease of toxin-antitoxin system